jgi:hypothetical protein
MPLYHGADPYKCECASKIEEKRIRGSVRRFRILSASVLVAKKSQRNGVETYIAVTLSKMVDRTCHFSMRRIRTSMNGSLKLKRNESGEVYVL